ncbi:MAG: hypothetical protein MZW92_15475 [Comamonadaceae bacterium]|nr:hypothetical protein [Comamonadaceae bacterium]
MEAWIPNAGTQSRDRRDERHQARFPLRRPAQTRSRGRGADAAGAGPGRMGSHPPHRLVAAPASAGTRCAWLPAFSPARSRRRSWAPLRRCRPPGARRR